MPPVDLFSCNLQKFSVDVKNCGFRTLCKKLFNLINLC